LTAASGSPKVSRSVLPPPGIWSWKPSYAEETMPSNPNFKDLFKLFNGAGVEYLVSGAHAASKP